MDTVLFLGSRSAALRAARRMGVSALVLAERRPTVRVAGSAVVDLDAEPGLLLAQTAALVGRRRVDAVVATVERGVVPAAHLRDRLGLPGADVATARRCHDKLEMKRAIRAAGIPCASFAEVDARTRPQDLVDELGLPLVLKPRSSSGARETFVISDARQLRHAVGPGMMAESLVRGTEMSVETFVVDGRAVFRNRTEYHVPFWVNVLPAPLPAADRRAVDALVDRSIAALGIRDGVTHLELFLTDRGPLFGELALRPPGGHLMELMGEAYGFDPWESVLAMALRRPVDLPRRATRVAAAWILHPGPGRVTSVAGLEEARRIPLVSHVACRVGPGDRVPPRHGSGDEVGHLRVATPTRPQTLATLEAARAHVHSELVPPGAGRGARPRPAAARGPLERRAAPSAGEPPWARDGGAFDRFAD